MEHHAAGTGAPVQTRGLGEMLNYEQYMSAIRWGWTTAGGYLIGRGWVDAPTWGLVSLAGLTLAPLGWGLLRHTWANTLLAATDVPGTEKVVNPSMSALPSSKITAS